MNMIRFINELAANVGIGAGEKRFARRPGPVGGFPHSRAGTRWKAHAQHDAATSTSADAREVQAL